MNLDVLSVQHSYLNINVKLIQILGLDTAAYLTTVLDALHQAVKKNKVDDKGFFRIDRKYVNEKTGLATSEQKQCDERLMSISLLMRDADKAELISIDVGAIMKLIQEDDSKLTDKIKLNLAKLKKTEKEALKKEQYNRYLKSLVKTTDFEVRDAFFVWIDAMDGSLTKATVPVAESAIDAYTTVKAIKIKLLEIMASNGWRDTTWAIKRYEQEYARKADTQRVATSIADINTNNKF